MEEFKDLTPQSVEKVYWEAMKYGWGSGEIKKQTAPLLPGYKCIHFASGKFDVLDAYCKTPFNNRSTGFTLIWFNKIPVWTMNYGGEYTKEVILFLKLALQRIMTERIFMGGRGPSVFYHNGFPGLTYRNEVQENSFLKFAGREEIRNANSLLLGYHDYQGLCLI